MLRITELPLPFPGRGEVRIKVAASAVNVDDQHCAEGTMFGGFPVVPTPTELQPWVPGTDFAGTVDLLGRDVKGLEIGQWVYGMRPPRLAGPWAEYAVTRATHVAPIPDGWSAEEAGSTCLAGMVISSIVDVMGSPKDKHCLVVGASGSIGTMLVPALTRARATVWGVCSARNKALVEKLGAARVIDYRKASFGDQMAAARTKVDVVIDLVGGRDVERQGRAVTKPEGIFITVVGPEKHVGERKLGTLGLCGMIGHIGWSWLRSRVSGPKYTLVGPLAPDFSAIDRWIVTPNIRPTIDRIVPFEASAVSEAVTYVASHHARGRVVISMV